MREKNYKPATIAARAGVEKDTQFGSVMPPLYLSTNYTFAGYNDKRKYDYSRSGNPTRDELGDALAALDNGAGGVITSSGMSALDLVFHLLDPNDTILAPHDCYGGTYRLLKAMHDKGHYKVVFVDQTNMTALEEAFSLKPRMILIETPSNPLLRITDVEKICELAKPHNTLVAADNTFMSPVCQRPIDLGADLVIHASTKYINGHSDVVAGAVVAKTQDLYEKLAWWANCIGITGAIFDSYLTMRGLRTLDVRLRQMQETTEKIIDFLQGHDAISTVHYPGLKSHPGHDIAARQQLGFGPMFSFELNGGEDAVRSLLASLHLFSLAESLGGFESLICHPPTMTHAAMDREAQENAGISMNLIRISTGLEDANDLIADLDQALKKASSAKAA